MSTLLKCVNVTGGVSLTEGKNYQEISKTEKYYTIRNDMGSQEDYYEWRFEKVEEHPSAFTIKGKIHHIRAIFEDLVELGYYYGNQKSTDPSFIRTTALTQNCCGKRIGTKDSLLNLYWDATSQEQGKVFNLPEDYKAALDFAKEQASFSFESKPESVEVTVGDPATTFMVYKNGRVFCDKWKETDNLQISVVNTLLEKFRLISGSSLQGLKLTPKVHVGCSSGIIVSEEDLNTVIDAYNTLQNQ